jgi:translocation protein SEC63
VELDDPALNQSKIEAAPIAHALNNSFTTIALAFGSTGPILASYATSQNLIQAMTPKASPLLQLPHITPAIAKAIDGDSKTHLSLQQYMALPEAYRQKISVGKGLLTEAQYKRATSVARQLPFFQVEKAFFKVTGEKYITPGSLVSFIVKGRFIPPGSPDVPEVDAEDLEDIDFPEGDLAAVQGQPKKLTKDGKVIQIKTILPPLAYAPYFARDYSPRWHVFLTDSKQGKIAVPPFTFTTFDEPIFDEAGKPTFNVQTLKAQFQAPPQAGHYTFAMHLICDSYVGADTKLEVTLVVEDANKANEMADDDDISEPDEDSIAGQMHALKTGGLSAPSKKKKQARDDSSEDESNTDEDEEDDTSETDTDTDTDGE